MAFTLQNDQGTVAGANAYIDVVYFKGYHDDRGRADAYGAATDTQIQAAIVQATWYLDGRFQFIGWRQQSDQSTQWPRYDALDNDYQYVNGVPREVKDATAEYALRALPGIVATPTSNTLLPDPARSETGAVVQESKQKVGPIEEVVRYSGGGAYSMPPYPYADMILKKRGLVVAGGTFVRGA